MKMKSGKEEIDAVIREMIKEDELLFEEICESTPAVRVKWSLDDWVYGIGRYPGLIEEDDCPLDYFSPQQWKKIIVYGCGIEAQYCGCCKEVLALLSKKDFKDMDSLTMCTIIVLEGEWIAHLMPLSGITQEDFDNIFVCDPSDYSCEQDVLDLIAVRFPGSRIPDHLEWPYKKKKR